MEKKRMLSKRKMIILSAVAVIVLLSGITLYTNAAQQEQARQEQIKQEQVEQEQKEQQAKEEQQKKAEEEAKAKSEADAKVQAEADAKAQAEADAKAQAKAEEQARAIAEAKKNANKPITYTSKSLGISFDMPASWANKYVIKDNGTTINVSMKNPQVNTGRGFLFLITTDLATYDNGNMLDSIGVDKLQTIKGRKYLIASQTGCTVEIGDPDIELYKTMTRQLPQVAKTIR